MWTTLDHRMCDIEKPSYTSDQSLTFGNRSGHKTGRGIKWGRPILHQRFVSIGVGIPGQPAVNAGPVWAGDEPETSIVQCGVVQGDPEAD